MVISNDGSVQEIETLIMTEKPIHHIVIVGGGAAGLELATKLGDSIGRKNERALRWSIVVALIFGSHSCTRSQREVCAVRSTN